MQLKITTDYAIRVVVYLASVDRIASSLEISEAMKIPQQYLINTMSAIRKSGIIKTISGHNGGYALVKKPEDISLFDIINVMENTMKINRCLENDAFCSRNATSYCSVHKVYDKIQKELEKSFSNITISNILSEKN